MRLKDSFRKKKYDVYLNGEQKTIDSYEWVSFLDYDKLHREDGPAVESTDGYKEYYLNGKLHRTDGPARITGTLEVYALDGEVMSFDFFSDHLKLIRNMPPEIRLTDPREWVRNFKEI